MSSTTPSGPANTNGAKNTTQKGPWGGGNQYGQMPTMGKNFIAVPPVTGHTQKRNVEYKRPGKG